MPANAIARVEARLELGQPVEQQVDLELRALRLGAGLLALAHQDPQHPGRDVRQHVARRDGVNSLPVVPGDLGTVVAGPDLGDSGGGDDLGAGFGGRLRQRPGDRPHATDRHPPLAVTVADQVVEEAAVLDQGGVVQRGEGADEGVGGDHAAHRVVGEASFDRLTERPRDQIPPHVGVGGLADRPLGRQWVEQRRGDHLGEPGHLGVERLPGGVLVVAAGEVAERCGGGWALGPLDEQPAVLPAADGRGVRRGGPRGEGDVETQLGHQLFRHQRDEVGVPRQPGGVPGEGHRGHRSAARVGQPLEDQDRESGTRQIGRSN